MGTGRGGGVQCHPTPHFKNQVSKNLLSPDYKTETLNVTKNLKHKFVTKCHPPPPKKVQADPMLAVHISSCGSLLIFSAQIKDPKYHVSKQISSPRK
jgi:hypothetical protein